MSGSVVTRRVSPLGGGVQLDREAVYLSPGGRRCRWWPDHGRTSDQHHQAKLVYDLRDGRAASSALSESFVLARENWHLLRRVA